MPVETRVCNVPLSTRGFSLPSQIGRQSIGTGKGVMALDDGDTSTGCQPLALFPQACTSGMLLEFSQVGCSQRQAQTPIAYESNVIAAEDDRPEGNVIASLSVRPLDLDRHIPTQPMNNDLIAIFIDNSPDELVEHRIESFL